MDTVDTSGFARLGQILGGGSAASPAQAAQFALAQDRQASLQEKLAKAGIDRAQLLALQSIPVAHSQSLVAQNYANDPGNPLGSAAAIAAARAGYADAITMSPSGTGANLKDFNESQLTDQKSEMARIAMQAGQQGDYKKMNAALAALDGKPMNVDKVDGGVSYNPTLAPNQQTAVVLPTGQAEIANKNALSMDAIARAAASNSQVPLHNAQTETANARTDQIRNPLGHVGVPFADKADLTILRGVEAQRKQALAGASDDAAYDGINAKYGAMEQDLIAKHGGTPAAHPPQMSNILDGAFHAISSALGGSAPHASPGANTGNSVAYSKAKAAIAAGADPAKVNQRLKAAGLQPIQ